MTLRNCLTYIGISLVFLGVGFLFGSVSRRNAPNSEVKEKVDTVIVRDTLVDYNPQVNVIPKGWQLVKSETIEEYETLIERYQNRLVEKPMIVTVRDTLYLAVPITETTYTDGKTYKCAVEGYRTKMLWHESYQQATYVTKTVPAESPKWAISPYLGASYSIGSIGMGVGVKMDFWYGKWALSPNVGYGAYTSGGKLQNGLEFGFEVSYELFSK